MIAQPPQCFKVTRSCSYPGYLGRKLTVINSDKGPAVGPIETMVPGLHGQVAGLPGQKVNGD